MAEVDQALILDIYDTVLDGGRWPAVLDKVAAALGARGCILFELETQPDGSRRLSCPHVSGRYDRAQVGGYVRQFAEMELADQDVFARHSAAGDRIEVIGDEVLAESAAALKARPNARAMAEFGILHRAGALLSKDNPAQDRFSIQFSGRHGPLGQGDREKLRLLLPHLAKACDLGRPLARLKDLSANLSSVLDHFRIGVCLIRADRSIVAQNAEFTRQMAEAGSFRRTPSGRIEMVRARDQQWFVNLCTGAARHGRFGARPRKEALGGTRPDGAGRLAVEIAPLTSADAFGERRLDGFAVYSLDTARAINIDLDLVSKVLTLTASETALVGMVADGLTNREIAERRDRSVETVNTQVKHLLAKADCANRTQLVRRVTTIGADFLTP
ncbi:MAG: helix-turn-helix transcriptional regulator [Pseudomonadota bacterium]